MGLAMFLKKGMEVNLWEQAMPRQPPYHHNMQRPGFFHLNCTFRNSYCSSLYALHRLSDDSIILLKPFFRTA